MPNFASETATFVLLAFFLLNVKHFLIDFPWQPPFMWMNKGTYGHVGGISHATLHAFGTFFVFMILFDRWNETAAFVCLYLAAIDAFVHYHIDWAKMNINKMMGWGPTTHAEFWTLTGLDQFLHQATYVALIALVVLK